MNDGGTKKWGGKEYTSVIHQRMRIPDLPGMQHRSMHWYRIKIWRRFLQLSLHHHSIIASFYSQETSLSALVWMRWGTPEIEWTWISSARYQCERQLLSKKLHVLLAHKHPCCTASFFANSLEKGTRWTLKKGLVTIGWILQCICWYGVVFPFCKHRRHEFVPLWW